MGAQDLFLVGAARLTIASVFIIAHLSDSSLKVYYPKIAGKKPRPGYRWP